MKCETPILGISTEFAKYNFECENQYNTFKVVKIVIYENLN